MENGVRKNKKHDGFKIFSRFLKEHGMGFNAVCIDKNYKQAIDEERLSIWVFINYMPDSKVHELHQEWHDFIVENGYYDTFRTPKPVLGETVEPYYGRFVIYKRKTVKNS